MKGTKEALIHQTAVVSPNADLASDVRVDAFSVIGPGVEIGSGTWIGPHSVVDGRTRIGSGNRIYGQSSIGRDPQDLKYQGEESFLEIGDDNQIREFVTLNRGTAVAGGVTRIGSRNLLMTGVHVGHDCCVGSDSILANSVTLGGHVQVEDAVTVAAFSGVHQFCRVGYRAFIGGYSVITRDALPFVKTVGSRGEARTYGINTVGLQRAGFSEERISALKKAYRLIVRSGLSIDQADERVLSSGLENDDVALLIRFARDSERGFIR